MLIALEGASPPAGVGEGFEDDGVVGKERDRASDAGAHPVKAGAGEL